ACPDSSSRKDTPHRRIRRLAAASGVMTGLAVLTKTVSGLLPLAIAAIFLSTSSKRMYFFRPLALAALIAIVLPALYFTPHCLFSELACESFFTKELFHRVRYGYHNPQDTWLYLRPLFRGHLVGSALLIWLMLCWAAWRVFAKKDAGTFFLCVWAALPLAGYTCIPSRQFWYIAPAFVPLSLLMGRALWSVAGMCCTLISPLPGYRRLWQLGGSLACMLLLGHAALVLSQDIVHTINGAAKKSPRPLVDRLAEEIISTARQHPERAGVITLGETLAKDAHPKYGHFSTEVIYRGMIEGYFYNAADLAEAQALAQSGQFGFLIAPLALEEELLTLPSIHAYQILGPSRFRKEALLVLGLSPSSGKRPALLNTKRVYNFASAAAPPVSGFGPAEHLGQFWARALDGNR
ncbi:MAG TPA: hypothetical protein PLP17_15530, partial [Oligoflexia bacterium]|nr:hypothetical protein [Oligoflexia bacterium]